MAKELSDAQRDARKARSRRARAAAQSAGTDWRQLSPEERKEFRRAVRGNVGAKAGGDPARRQARKAAEADGHAWRELPKERRQEYLERARQTS